MVPVLVGALLVVAGMAVPPSPAGAVEATPIGSQTFEQAPHAVELGFDPSVDVQAIQIVVIAPNGARADDGITRTTAEGIRSTLLRPGLGNGDYLVYWISGEPGTRAESFGELSFSITGASPCQPVSNATPRPPAEECLADPVSGAPGEAIASNGISVTLDISSDQAGPVDLSATVMDGSGAPVEDAMVWFRARHLEMSHGELPYLAAHAGPGVYQASFVGMGMGGHWRVAVDVVLPGQPPVTVFVDQTMVE
jgi:methionine-rich copper-binding protein CopC